MNIGDLLGGQENGDHFGLTLATGDLNGDGIEDLVAGTPFEDIDDVLDAGAVSLIFGSPSGLSTANNQFLSQKELVVNINGDGKADSVVERGAFGVTERSDLFGWKVAVANINGDLYDDLIISAVAETTGFDGADYLGAGVVHFIPGNLNGLKLDGQQVWNQSAGFATAGQLDGEVAGTGVRAYARFGDSLTGADLNGDGFEDLDIGYPMSAGGIASEHVGAGGVYIFYGTASGFSAELTQYLWQSEFDLSNYADDVILDIPAGEEWLGLAVTTGDYNGDGLKDLSISAPYDMLESGDRDGAIFVLFGQPGAGLSGTRYQKWSRDGGYENGKIYLGELVFVAGEEIGLGWGLH